MHQIAVLPGGFCSGYGIDFVNWIIDNIGDRSVCGGLLLIRYFHFCFVLFGFSLTF